MNVSKIEETRARRAKYSKIAGAVKSAVAIIKNPRIMNEGERLAICKKCEHYNNGRCKVCGCFMFIKTRFAAMKCPINKWS